MSERVANNHRIIEGYCFDCGGGGCILELAEDNARRIYRASRIPHPWDEWDVNEQEVPQEQEAGW